MTMLSNALAAVALFVIGVSPAFADEGSATELSATNAIWKAVVAVGVPENSREMLLNQFNAVIRDFPDSPHAETARKYASILESMIRQDRDHKTLTSRIIKGNDPSRKIATRHIHTTMDAVCDQP